jgi:hypothetical protein
MTLGASGGGEATGVLGVTDNVSLGTSIACPQARQKRASAGFLVPHAVQNDITHLFSNQIELDQQSIL